MTVTVICVLNFEKKRGMFCGKSWLGFLSTRTSRPLFYVCALNLAYIDIIGLLLLFSTLCLIITICVKFLYDITSRTVASLFSLIILYQLLPDLSSALSIERGADLHIDQLMPLPLTVSCFSKIQIGLTFLVPAHLGSPGKRAVKRVCVL